MVEMTLQIAFLGSPLFLAALAGGLCMKLDCLKWLKSPIDAGLLFRGRRVFGDNKTWRGLCLMTLFSTLGGWVQSLIQREGLLPQWLPLCDYGRLWLPVGAGLGLGAALGELPNSFLKRQLGVQPGKRKNGLLWTFFFLLDQVDLTIGVWVFLYFLIRPTDWLVIWSFVLTVPLHLLISLIGYGLGMRKTFS